MPVPGAGFAPGVVPGVAFGVVLNPGFGVYCIGSVLVVPFEAAPFCTVVPPGLDDHIFAFGSVVFTEPPLL